MKTAHLLFALLAVALYSRPAACATDDEFLTQVAFVGDSLHSAIRPAVARGEDYRGFVVPVTHQVDENDPRYIVQKDRIELVKRLKRSIVFLGMEIKKETTQDNEKKRGAVCTGFFTDTQGILSVARYDLITTNSHCVEEGKIGDEIEVGLFTNSNGFPKMLKGKVLAFGNSGNEKDIAFVQIIPQAPEDLRPPLPLLVDKLDDAEDVLAIGHPYGEQWSITKGIVSGLNRTHIQSQPFLNGTQTDAAINPGNSGGPLVNLWGDVVGMNTAVVRGANSMGFAIPAKYIIEALKQYERVGNIDIGYLGIEFGPNKDTRKLTVVSIRPDSPAKTVGLKEKDELVQIDDVQLDTLPTPEDAMSAILVHIKFKSPKESIYLTVKRNGQVQPAIQIVLGSIPKAPERPEIVFPMPKKK